MESKTTKLVVLDVVPFSGEHIEMSGAWPSSYTRYSSNSWTVTMGESDEPIYACEDLEEAYQLWKSKQ